MNSGFTQVTRNLIPTLATNFGIQVCCWGIAAALQTEKV